MTNKTKIIAAIVGTLLAIGIAWVAVGNSNNNGALPVFELTVYPPSGHGFGHIKIDLTFYDAQNVVKARKGTPYPEPTYSDDPWNGGWAYDECKYSGINRVEYCIIFGDSQMSPVLNAVGGSVNLDPIAGGYVVITPSMWGGPHACAYRLSDAQPHITPD